MGRKIQGFKVKVSALPHLPLFYLDNIYSCNIKYSTYRAHIINEHNLILSKELYMNRYLCMEVRYSQSGHCSLLRHSCSVLPSTDFGTIFNPWSCPSVHIRLTEFQRSLLLLKNIDLF